MPHTMDTDRRETHKMQETGFTVDRDKCTGCGLCVKVCPGGVLSLDGTKTVRMAPFEEYGWNGCWQCEHCLAVCPAGAVSIFGHRPEDSLPPVSGPQRGYRNHPGYAGAARERAKRRQ